MNNYELIHNIFTYVSTGTRLSEPPSAPIGHKNDHIQKSKSRSVDLSSLTKPLNNEISDCFHGSFHLEYITQA